MNFGYANADPADDVQLEPSDERERYALQMYHHVASQITVHDLDVLEVGSGRGGGASYVMRYLHPRTYTAIDVSTRAIAFCREQYRLPGLTFLNGDAEHLEFPDTRFDVVLNIESSSHYGDIQKFFDQVYRVLRPGGYFLYADLWQPHELSQLKHYFARAGLKLCRSEDMAPAVFIALDRDDARRHELIERYAPRWMHGAFTEFAGVRGSTNYENFRTGRVQYLCCLLQKPDPLGSSHMQTQTTREINGTQLANALQEQVARHI